MSDNVIPIHPAASVKLTKAEVRILLMVKKAETHWKGDPNVPAIRPRPFRGVSEEHGCYFPNRTTARRILLELERLELIGENALYRGHWLLTDTGRRVVLTHTPKKTDENV